MKALFDTNILIDYLNGIELAKDEIARYSRVFISPITWMEVMVGVPEQDERQVKNFLNRFDLISIDTIVAEKAVELRRNYKIRLPDAIIWASSQKEDALLITRNTKDFPESNPSVRVPYQV